jgi:CheY-like chemotaxis protein
MVIACSVFTMGNTFQILILEDNLGTKEILKKTFSRLGCHVTFAESSEDGIAQLLKTHFDAVFAELCIRGEKGARGLARWVKCKFPNTKFFLVTSWKGDLDRKSVV